MKTEFKTLKDIKIDKDNWEEDDNIPIHKIKAETVKHYKAIKNGDLIIDILSYIRWCNNLSEEDFTNAVLHKTAQLAIQLDNELKSGKHK